MACYEEGMITLRPESTVDDRFVYISDWTDDTVRVSEAQTLKKITEPTDVSSPTRMFSVSRRHEHMGH
jgi:nitrite reductase (NO-forming)/hydroxylamine reductase